MSAVSLDMNPMEHLGRPKRSILYRPQTNVGKANLLAVNITHLQCSGYCRGITEESLCVSLSGTAQERLPQVREQNAQPWYCATALRHPMERHGT